MILSSDSTEVGLDLKKQRLTSAIPALKMALSYLEPSLRFKDGNLEVWYDPGDHTELEEFDPSENEYEGPKDLDLGKAQEAVARVDPDFRLENVEHWPVGFATISLVDT